MKLFSQRSEIRAIKTICNGNIPNEIRARFLASLTEIYFHYPPTKAAFRRVFSFAKKRGKILDWNDLLEDGSLDEEFRSLLETSELKSLAASEEKIKDLFDTLHQYKTLRGVYDIAETAVDEIKKKAVDSEELLNTLANKFTSLRQTSDLDEIICKIGFRNNSAHLVKDILYGEVEPMIKTGIPSIDERNGGLPIEGVHLLAGTTSGGKSTIAMQLLLWIHKINKLDTLMLSLEMGEKQLMQRLVSNLSGVMFSKIKRNDLSPDDKSKIKAAYNEFRNWGKRNKCSYDLMCPVDDISSDKLFLTLQAYNYSVVCIDYIGLFSDSQRDDQWKALSEVARQAKIFSRKNKCLVIILAQLDSEDDRIRYSKGVLEHADGAWIFNYSKPEVRDTHTIPMKQLKARDGQLFPFDLKENYAVMRVSPVDGEDTVQGEEDDILKEEERTAIDKSAGLS